MSISIKNLFKQNPKVKDEAPTEEEKPVEEQTQPAEEAPVKKTILRGPGGKFISKKKLAAESKTAEVNEKEKTPVAKSDDVQTPQALTFYGQNIRKFNLDGVCYFSIIDILPLAKVIDPEKYLNELKKKEEFKKVFKSNLHIISDVECVTYEGFTNLLPAIRSDEHMFPGPFPSWLEEMAKVSKK